MTPAGSPSAHPTRGPYGPEGRSAWQDVDWRAHQRWARVEDRWMNVIDIGEGPVVLFVHGVSGCWQNWLENIPYFARDHRVVAVDLPGFGASEMPARKISISRYADTLDALMDILGIGEVRLVGNSMGGFIGAELAIRFPARIERLALAAPSVLSIEGIRTQRQDGLRHRVEDAAFSTIGWVSAHAPDLAHRPRLREALFLLVAAHPGRLPQPLLAEQARGFGKPGLADALSALCSYPIRERLGEIACPTLIVWGTRDVLVPVWEAARFARRVPGSRRLIYRDTGHVSMLERPARFNADVHAFLREPRSPAATG